MSKAVGIEIGCAPPPVTGEDDLVSRERRLLGISTICSQQASIKTLVCEHLHAVIPANRYPTASF